MSVLEAAIGWLAPPDCLSCGAEGDALCLACSVSEIQAFGERCWRCNSLSPGSKTCPKCRPAGPLNAVWITTDYNGLARQLVSLYKFGHLRAAAYPISRMTCRTFLDYSGDPAKNYLIVPLPTATSRLRQRGFGHSELLAKSIAHNLHLEYTGALRRLGQSRQLGSSRQDRLVQLAHGFAVKSPRKVAGRHILLVDDVLTTGGSLISAAKSLKLAGAKRVDALVFAKRL